MFESYWSSWFFLTFLPFSKFWIKVISGVIFFMLIISYFVSEETYEDIKYYEEMRVKDYKHMRKSVCRWLWVFGILFILGCLIPSRNDILIMGAGKAITTSENFNKMIGGR